MMFTTLVLFTSCIGKELSNSNIEGHYAYAFFNPSVDESCSAYMGGFVEFNKDGRFEDERVYRFYASYATGVEESEYRVIYVGIWKIDKDTLRMTLSEAPRIEYLGKNDGFYAAEDVITNIYAPCDCKIVSLDKNIVVKRKDALLELFPCNEGIKPISGKDKETDDFLINNCGVGSYSILYPFYYEHPEDIRKVLGDKYIIEKSEGMYNDIYSFTLKSDTTVTFVWDDRELVFHSPKYHTQSGLHVGCSIVDFLFINGFSKKCYTTKYEPTWVTDGKYRYLLSFDEPVSSHYREVSNDDYWSEGNITNLNAVISEIVVVDYQN